MTPDQAADLAARTLAAIGHPDPLGDLSGGDAQYAADRERVASDLAGLLRHNPGSDNDCGPCEDGNWCEDRPAFADGLRRTATLYGVTP